VKESGVRVVGQGAEAGEPREEERVRRRSPAEIVRAARARAGSSGQVDRVSSPAPTGAEAPPAREPETSWEVDQVEAPVPGAAPAAPPQAGAQAAAGGGLGPAVALEVGGQGGPGPGPGTTGPRPGARPAGASPRRVSPPRARVLASVLALALALAVAAAVVFGVLWSGQHRADASRQEAVKTAEDLMLALTNFDASTIDRDFKRISTYATGQFAQQLPPTFGNPKLRRELEQANAKSRGRVHALYLKVGGPSNQASVYVVVDQTSESNRYKGLLTDVIQAKVDMVMTPRGWRVDHLSAINSQANPGSSPLFQAEAPSTRAKKQGGSAK